MKYESTAIQVRVQGNKKGFATDCLPSFSARRLEESGLSTSCQGLVSECLERYAGCLREQSFVEALPHTQTGNLGPAGRS